MYVLANRATYSAVMVNVVQFRQLLNARIVGEPTGANSNGYQEMGQFHLPNSSLLIPHSKRLFRLQESDTLRVQPDVLIVPKWKNHQEGIDGVLEWVLEVSRKPAPKEELIAKEQYKIESLSKIAYSPILKASAKALGKSDCSTAVAAFSISYTTLLKETSSVSELEGEDDWSSSNIA